MGGTRRESPMHRTHLGPCLALAALGVALMIGLGSPWPFAVFLLCPLVMGGFMWWMARSAAGDRDRNDHVQIR